MKTSVALVLAPADDWIFQEAYFAANTLSNSEKRLQELQTKCSLDYISTSWAPASLQLMHLLQECIGSTSVALHEIDCFVDKNERWCLCKVVSKSLAKWLMLLSQAGALAVNHLNSCFVICQLSSDQAYSHCCYALIWASWQTSIWIRAQQVHKGWQSIWQYVIRAISQHKTQTQQVQQATHLIRQLNTSRKNESVVLAHCGSVAGSKSLCSCLCQFATKATDILA